MAAQTGVTRRRVRAKLLALFATLALVTAVVGGAASRLSRGGDLDPSFGRGGLVTTDLTGDIDSACCVALQPDGRIVVAGSEGSSGASAGRGFVARYLSNGSLDTSFGGSGVVRPRFGPGDDLVQALAIQADGKVVAAGSIVAPDTNIALARYNPDGSLDTSFGGNGKVVTGFSPSSRERALSLLVAPDGKIIVGGAARGAGLSIGNFLVARYEPNGTLDATFGQGGKTIVDFGALGEAHGLALDANGKIIAVGGTFTISAAGAFWGKSFLAARYNADGSLDSSFGGGKVATGFGASTGSALAMDVVVQRDGKIVSVGWVDNRAAAVRHNADGSLDSTFGDEGTLLIEEPAAGSSLAAVAIDSRDRILAAGNAAGAGLDFELIRLKPNGTLDPSFGDGGRAVTNFSGASIDSANALWLQQDGKVVLAGDADGSVAVARYLPTYCFVPNVRGKSLAVARAGIVKAHCRVGKLKRVSSRTVRAGRVVSQTPRAGTQQREDTAVALTISRGR